jgi:hypothetical protein
MWDPKLRMERALMEELAAQLLQIVDYHIAEEEEEEAADTGEVVVREETPVQQHLHLRLIVVLVAAEPVDTVRDYLEPMVVLADA